MNETNRQKVLEFCTDYDTYPLYFKNRDGAYKSPVEEFDPRKYSVDDMVKRVLALAEDYASYNSNINEFESSSDRWRSSLDIWRHIIYYYPTIEIFDVMHSLYKMYHKKDGVCGQFCSTIERRTFKLQTGYPTTENYMSAIYLYMNNDRKFDEYGLDWEDWKDI